MEKIYIVCRQWASTKSDTIVCAYKDREKALKRVELENQFIAKDLENGEEPPYYAWYAERNLYI